MSSAPCFSGCGRPRLKGHVTCEVHHSPDTCEKCLRQQDLNDRMDKRRTTIAKRRVGST